MSTGRDPSSGRFAAAVLERRGGARLTPERRAQVRAAFASFLTGQPAPAAPPAPKAPAPEPKTAEEFEAANAELRRSMQADKVQRAAADAARALRFADPAIAHRFLDQSAITFDDAGAPTNVAELVGGLRTSMPKLFAGAPAPRLDQGARETAPTEGPSAREVFREQFSSWVRAGGREQYGAAGWREFSGRH